MAQGIKMDLTGMRFKTYTAIEPVGRASGGSVIWRCVCDCGLEKDHQIGNLRNGSVRCKCQNLPPGESAFRELFSYYKSESSVKRKLEFTLSKDYFKELVTSICHYCGREPFQEFKGKSSAFKYNGIDRVDNDEGYIDGNVVSCCGDCNRAKRIMTKEQFSTWIKRVYTHLASKQ